MGKKIEPWNVPLSEEDCDEIIKILQKIPSVKERIKFLENLKISIST